MLFVQYCCFVFHTWVLVVVNFYAKGSYQRVTGDNFIANVGQPSVSRCIHSVNNVINQKLLRRRVCFKMTAIERDNAIDCTNINILTPKNHKEAYVNHHGNHSLNVQAVCIE